MAPRLEQGAPQCFYKTFTPSHAASACHTTAVKTDTALAIAWLACLAAFVALGVNAAGREAPGIDLDIAKAVQDLPNGLGPVFDLANWLGGDLPLTLLTVVLLVVVFQFRLRLEALLLGLTLVPRLLNALIKELVESPRPTPDQLAVSDTVQSFAYPSGHAVGTTVVFVLLFVLTPRLGLDLRLQRLVQAFSLLMVLTIGLARVWAGVHWPTDVTGGYLLALLWLIPTLRFYGFRRSRVADDAIE
jgi:membrane-associated phospholipid phosphatase